MPTIYTFEGTNSNFKFELVLEDDLKWSHIRVLVKEDGTVVDPPFEIPLQSLRTGGDPCLN